MNAVGSDFLSFFEFDLILAFLDACQTVDDGKIALMPSLAQRLRRMSIVLGPFDVT